MADLLKSATVFGIICFVIAAVAARNEKIVIRKKYALPGGRSVHVFDNALQHNQVLQLMDFMISNDNWR